LSIVYSTECKEAQKATRPAAMLPILVVLFVVSYSLLTMLVFEQGQTIEAQRGLIREMLKDSTQLAAIKGKLARDANQHPDNQRAGAHDKISGQADTNNPGPAAAPPSGSEKTAKRHGKSAHTTREAPGKPASDLEDVRRSTRVI
jgi:hypothetical protein